MRLGVEFRLKNVSRFLLVLVLGFPVISRTSRRTRMNRKLSDQGLGDHLGHVLHADQRQMPDLLAATGSRCHEDGSKRLGLEYFE